MNPKVHFESVLSFVLDLYDLGVSTKVMFGSFGKVPFSLMSLKVIHFQSIFLIDFYLKKGLIYMQKCGITHQNAMQQEIQEKEDIAVEGAESG